MWDLEFFSGGKARIFCRFKEFYSGFVLVDQNDKGNFWGEEVTDNDLQIRP
jgi:hypothetical protein